MVAGDVSTCMEGIDASFLGHCSVWLPRKSSIFKMDIWRLRVFFSHSYLPGIISFSLLSSVSFSVPARLVYYAQKKLRRFIKVPPFFVSSIFPVESTG